MSESENQINNTIEDPNLEKLTLECLSLIQENPGEAAKEYAKAIINSLTDSLTGLKNGRFMNERLKELVSITERRVNRKEEFKPFVLVFFNLDN